MSLYLCPLLSWMLSYLLGSDRCSQLPRITSSIFGGLRVARTDTGGTFQRKELKDGRTQKRNEKKWLKFHSLCL